MRLPIGMFVADLHLVCLLFPLVALELALVVDILFAHHGLSVLARLDVGSKVVVKVRFQVRMHGGTGNV